MNVTQRTADAIRAQDQTMPEECTVNEHTTIVGDKAVQAVYTDRGSYVNVLLRVRGQWCRVDPNLFHDVYADVLKTCAPRALTVAALDGSAVHPAHEWYTRYLRLLLSNC